MAMLKTWLRTALIAIGWIKRLTFVGKVMTRHPSPQELEEGGLVLVRDEQHDKWACFRCPGGCGQKIQLSLSRQRSPRWKVKLDYLNRPTVLPSVRMTNHCGCHFWLQQGAVTWCPDSLRQGNKQKGCCGLFQSVSGGEK